MIRFFAAGDPVPKQSFRYVEREDGKGGGYTDPRVKVWQSIVGTEALLARNRVPAEMSTTQMAVALAFYLPTLRRVDSDNLSKCVLDGCNKVLWKDDCQVVDLHITKEYCGKQGKPGVLVEVAELTTKEERKARAQRVATRVEELTKGEGRGVALALFAHALMMECDWRKVDEMEKYIMRMVEA